ALLINGLGQLRQCPPKQRRHALPQTHAAVVLAQDVHARQPILELRRRAQAQGLACVQCVVKRGGLVIEHHVVRPRNAHDEIDPGHPEQGQQHVHVVLIGFGVVGVANVAAHRYTQQLAAEVIFKPRADDLFAVVQVFRADETHHRVDQKWIEMPCDRVGARFAGLLIDAVMSVRRQGTALPG
nr:hypothetical protein [Tanacetum cinerariifolium]